MSELSINKKKERKFRKGGKKKWEKNVLNVANMLAADNGCIVLRCVVDVTGSIEAKNCTKKGKPEQIKINKIIKQNGHKD
ncbi:hypothetical protein A3K73_00875 [Candidatus Pacearchaeota archaeon RBG_13_36_9]|nr:MAG: hypothetical protein A3K73_00875 [Candidatus Pacearchaeota archaeon RBG_13_36_9]